MCLLKTAFPFPILCFLVPVFPNPNRSPRSKDPTLLASQLLFLYADSTCLHQPPSMPTPTARHTEPLSCIYPNPGLPSRPGPTHPTELPPCIILPTLRNRLWCCFFPQTEADWLYHPQILQHWRTGPRWTVPILLVSASHGLALSPPPIQPSSAANQ